VLKFIPMTDADFAAFMRKSIPEYAYDQMHAGNWTQDEAVSRARSEFQQMLPDGLRTPNQHLYLIQDEHDQKIGMIWYFVEASRPRKTAFLIDFFIFPEERHRNYETDALALFEKQVQDEGVQRIELQIFAHKAEDLAMYRDAQYNDISIFLAKNF
jgi:acetyltransferase (GNAT) family protein